MTEQEAIEAELIQRELESRQQVQQQPVQQPQQNIGQMLGNLTKPNVFGPLANILPIEQAIGSVVGGLIQEPTRIVGRAGQAISGMMGGSTEPYTIPLPEYMGGNIDIKLVENWGQALGPVAGSALSMLGIKGVGKATTGSLMKFDNALTQAKNAKTALDELRTTLGKAKGIALKEVENVPAELDWGKNVSDKIVKAIQNPIYGVEFTEAGGVKGTIGNLDKVKEALYDILSTKDFVEAGKMEKRQILDFAIRTRDTILDAAHKVGKPQLAKSLRDYHNFMDNYVMANSKLVDSFDNAMANKLKATFRLTAEPRVKEAWDELGKSSPEIKAIVKSRKNRELLKALLVATPTVGGTIEVGKKLITGRW